MPDFIRNFFIGRVVVGIASGKYGQFAADAYAGLKGKKVYIGLAIFFISSALGDFASPVTAQFSPILMTVGSLLAALGVIDKPTLKSPPAIPPDVRETLAAVCSALTWLGAGSTGLITILQSIGSPRAMAVSGQVQFIVLALSTVSGYVANLVNNPYAKEPSNG